MAADQADTEKNRTVLTWVNTTSDGPPNAPASRPGDIEPVPFEPSTVCSNVQMLGAAAAMVLKFKTNDEAEEQLVKCLRDIYVDESRSTINSRIACIVKMVKAPLMNFETMLLDQPVTDLSQLRPGDHVYWSGALSTKYGCYFHHMLVFEVSKEELTVLEHTIQTLKSVYATLLTLNNGSVLPDALKKVLTLHPASKRQVISNAGFHSPACTGLVRKRRLKILTATNCAVLNANGQTKYEKKDPKYIRADLVKREYAPEFHDFVEWFYKHCGILDVKVDRSPEQRVARAMQCLQASDRPYQVFTRNCEHFVTFCCTGLHYSKQIHLMDEGLYRLHDEYGLTNGRSDFQLSMRFAAWRQGKEVIDRLKCNEIFPGITVTRQEDSA